MLNVMKEKGINYSDDLGRLPDLDDVNNQVS